MFNKYLLFLIAICGELDVADPSRTEHNHIKDMLEIPVSLPEILFLAYLPH